MIDLTEVEAIQAETDALYNLILDNERLFVRRIWNTWEEEVMHLGRS